MDNTLEEGEIVLCTITKIVGTTVFVKIDYYEKEGTIITSEVAPGRIRNLRDYVVPNKKIVCKVLRIDKDHIALSLRRVTAKEKRESLEKDKKEKSLAATIGSLIQNPQEVTKKIKEKSSLADFFEKVRENPRLLDSLMNKQEATKLLKVLEEKKEKEIYVKKKFSLSSNAEDGINRIKKILPEKVTYLAAGKFLITIKDKNYKDANAKVNSLLQEIEEKAKKESCSFALEK